MIRLRPYDSSDGVLRSYILSLLSEAFGEEGQPYYELAMEHLYDGEHTFLLCESDGALLAVALVVDYVDSSAGRWAYLYSFTTRKERRGEGLMSRLYREEIEPRLVERGYRGACLVPATSSLVSFYKAGDFICSEMLMTPYRSRRDRERQTISSPLMDSQVLTIPCPSG